MRIYQINNLEKKESKFYDLKMNEIEDESVIANFKKVALGFPKAILYSPPLKRKIYAVVRDNAGRTQYFYTKNYQDKMEEKKFKGLVKKVILIKKLVEECRRKVFKTNDLKMNEIYLAILMIYNCNFRVGNEKYKKLYNTNGTVTLRKENLKLVKDGIEIKFLGKKREENYSLLKKENEEKLFNYLLKIFKSDRKYLFENISYEDIYDYLKEKGTKPKDIRMISANETFFNEMLKNKIKRTATNLEKRKYLKNILELTSKKMNHTATVCKNKYLIPCLFEIDKLNYYYVKKYGNLEDYLRYYLKVR